MHVERDLFTVRSASDHLPVGDVGHVSVLLRHLRNVMRIRGS